MMVLMYSTTSPAMVGPSRVQSCSSTSVSRVVSHTTTEFQRGRAAPAVDVGEREDAQHVARARVQDVHVHGVDAEQQQLQLKSRRLPQLQLLNSVLVVIRLCIIPVAVVAVAVSPRRLAASPPRHSNRNPSQKIIVSEWAILSQVSFSNHQPPPLLLLPPPSSDAKARKRASFVKDKLRLRL
jgi:hypothetical protein